MNDFQSCSDFELLCSYIHHVNPKVTIYRNKYAKYKLYDVIEKNYVNY